MNDINTSLFYLGIIMTIIGLGIIAAIVQLKNELKK